ncbi:hypothetical protein K458DRAFT_436361, partial [Lentithecium fluviatile CBS 122367]
MEDITAPRRSARKRSALAVDNTSRQSRPQKKRVPKPEGKDLKPVKNKSLLTPEKSDAQALNEAAFAHLISRASFVVDPKDARECL